MEKKRQSLLFSTTSPEISLEDMNPQKMQAGLQTQTILTFWIVATKSLTGILPEDMFGSSKGVMTYRDPSPDYWKIWLRKKYQSPELPERQLESDQSAQQAASIQRENKWLEHGRLQHCHEVSDRIKGAVHRD